MMMCSMILAVTLGASSAAEGLFNTWMDAFLRLQVKGTGSKELDGGFLCPACEWEHGRTPDAVWPLTWAWKHTGERKYLDAAVRLVKWGRLNMERGNGAWINDPNAQWRGITVFGQTALGRALVLAKDDLPDEVRRDWTDAFARMTGYCYDWIEDPKTSVNVNYRAAYPLAMEFAYRLLGDGKYRKSGDGQMAFVEKFIADDGLFFGEAKPSECVSKRGFRGVDLGYNMEESLPAMLEWADLRGDAARMRKFLDSARAHLAFLLPDGGLDNSFGSRAYKWTYWGSRTSDGMLPALLYLAKDGCGEAVRALELQLGLYRRCTGREGLLTGGVHYPESGEPPCVHHTFCHLKTLPQVIDARLETKGAPLLSEKPFGLRRYRTNGVSICRVGDWRATFSENDLYFWDDRGKATGGGSLTLLWHAVLGPVFAASMSEWYLQEPGSMQQQRMDDVARCLTPRVETPDGAFKSVHDNEVAHTVAEEADGTVVSSAKGVLADDAGTRGDAAKAFTLDWRVGKGGVSVRATAADAARLVLPVIAGTADAVEVEGKVARIRRNGRTLTLTADADFTLERSERPDGRVFSPQTGFLAAYLTLPVSSAGVTTVRFADGFDKLR